MAQPTSTDASTATDDTNSVEVARLNEKAAALVDSILEWFRPVLIVLIVGFWQKPLTPKATLLFEPDLWKKLLEFGRRVCEGVYNFWDEDGMGLPRSVTFDGLEFRRSSRRARKNGVMTLFGGITLWRYLYRYCDRTVSQSGIFPLELRLGLKEGITPALASVIGIKMAEAGATQSRTIAFLKDVHCVSIGVGRLRKLVASLSSGLAEHWVATEAAQLLEALREACESKGSRKPVLAVGRDGITLVEYFHRHCEVATAGTFTVFDRAGKRLRTVYLAHRPELGQQAMTEMMTQLPRTVLENWTGPLPTLAYITDCGREETKYFSNVLRHMTHPRTGKTLEWNRVVDYYHASQRIWTMAEQLFGSGTARYNAWARKMLSRLKRGEHGIRQVLGSAASYAARIEMTATAREKFDTAYEYLRGRTRWLRYSTYAKRHIPFSDSRTSL